MQEAESLKGSESQMIPFILFFQFHQMLSLFLQLTDKCYLVFRYQPNTLNLKYHQNKNTKQTIFIFENIISYIIRCKKHRIVDLQDLPRVKRAIGVKPTRLLFLFQEQKFSNSFKVFDLNEKRCSLESV